MSFMDIDTTNVPDQQLLPAGIYTLECTAIDLKESKKNSDYLYINAVLTPVEQDVAEDPAPIYHMMGLPAEGEKASTNNSRLRKLRDFCTAFGLGPIKASTPEELLGHLSQAKGVRANALVRIDNPPQDSEYNPSNAVKAWK